MNFMGYKLTWNISEKYKIVIENFFHGDVEMPWIKFMVFHFMEFSRAFYEYFMYILPHEIHFIG